MYEVFSESDPETPSFSGTTLGVAWNVFTQPSNPRIVIGHREFRLTPDPQGGFRTHDMFGRWTDLGLLADQLVRLNPDLNPLARRTA